MKHEIEIPDGYEFKTMLSSIEINGARQISFLVEKKQTKDFNWYIDEYLREDPFTTKDEISNHLFTEDIKEIKTKLRSGDYRWVPWEIKIGLFRFICDDIKVSWIYQLPSSMEDPISKIVPIEFYNVLK